MFKKLINRKGQNTAEYAILIALVVAGIVAMQTYAQRALQSRVRDVSHFMTDATSNNPEFGNFALDDTLQYEPYYSTSEYTVQADSRETQLLNAQTNLVRQEDSSTTNRTGSTNTTYSAGQAGAPATDL